MRALDLHDYGRIDVRIAPAGQWFFLEANPNPAVVPPKFTWFTVWTGMEYKELLKEIVLSALKRNGELATIRRWQRQLNVTN